MKPRIVIAGWLAAAAVAVSASVTAVGMAGGGLVSGPPSPLSEDEVRRELARMPKGGPAASATAAPSTSATPGPSVPGAPGAPGTPAPGAGSQKVFSTPGGSVLARCSGGLVALVWWVPEQGYQVDGVERGPAAQAQVEFEGAGEVELTVACAGGVPRAVTDD